MLPVVRKLAGGSGKNELHYWPFKYQIQSSAGFGGS